MCPLHLPLTLLVPYEPSALMHHRTLERQRLLGERVPHRNWQTLYIHSKADSKMNLAGRPAAKSQEGLLNPSARPVRRGGDYLCKDVGAKPRKLKRKRQEQTPTPQPWEAGGPKHSGPKIFKALSASQASALAPRRRIVQQTTDRCAWPCRQCAEVGATEIYRNHIDELLSQHSHGVWYDKRITHTM